MSLKKKKFFFSPQRVKHITKTLKKFLQKK
jgi:hypothetical protein